MRISRALTSRPVTLLLASALVLPLAACTSDAPAPTTAPTTVATSGPTTAAPADPAATAAAALEWLGTVERTDGLFTTTFDGTSYPDQGLTLDVLVAALAAKDDAFAKDLAGTFTADVVDAYAGDGTTAGYAGATAKAAVVLGAAGQEIASTLDARLATFLGEDGRISDVGGDDYSSTVSQAWGVLALVRSDALAGDGAAARAGKAAAYLAEQQCDDGSYPAALEATECVGDVDSTAFALSALSAYVRSGATDVAAENTDGARDWLLGAAVDVDGGRAWQSGEPAATNVNSTAVALVALTDAGVGTTDVEGPRTWLAAQTVEADGGTALTFDGTAPDARASAQAIPALLGSGLVALGASGS